MNTTLALIRATRKKFIEFTEKFTIEQLNQIPAGFNNNIAWHLGHIMVSQQLLSYRLTGNPCLVSDMLLERYRHGTKPESFINEAEIEEIKHYLLANIDQLEADLQTDKFDKFNTYNIATYSFTLNNIKDVVTLVSNHDGLHYGYCMAMRKLL